jgi:uncharacterized protein (TIGR02270 family)
VRRIIPSIVEEHAEEAAFLWLLRDRSVAAPHVRLKDLAALDERVEAHIDGLRIAGEQGWDITRSALAFAEPGEVFAIAVLAFESGQPEQIAQALAVVDKKPDLARSVVSALGWLSPRQAQPFIQQFTASESPALRRIGVAAAAVHRINPGAVLEHSLRHLDHVPLTSRALRAAGELGLRQLVPAIQPFFDSPDDDVRFAAAWSAALLGDASAIRVLGAFAADLGPHAERACMLGLRCLSAAAGCKAHRELADRPELERLAVAAAGIIGDPALVDWLLRQMETPNRARLAGEAFVLITGAGIEHPDLVGQPPEGFESGPSDDPGDDEVAMDPDEHLAWPDPDKLKNWWMHYRSEFRSGTRYLLGNPVEPAWLHDVLRGGRQRQRAAAALELALERPGPLFEVRAPGFRQQATLRSRP